MAADQFVPSPLQPLALHWLCAQLRIAVAAGPTEFVAGVLAGGVGPLNVRHPEGHEARDAIMLDSFLGPQVLKDLGLVTPQARQVCWAQRALG